MEPKFVEKDTIKIVGLSCIANMSSNMTEDLGEIWGQFMKQMMDIPNRTDLNASYGISISLENPQKEGDFKYITGVEVKSFDEVPEGMMTYELPAGTYAFFNQKGSHEEFLKLFNAIYEWFQTKPEYDCSGPWVEYYDQRFKNFADDSEMDVLVSTIKKAQ